MNRNSHTTSTKCQYHEAASNPKWCEAEKLIVISRLVEYIMKIVPITTCIPWNPVAMKNVVP